MKKKIIAFLLLLLFSASNLSAQAGDVEMADTMRSNGKIFVVVGVIAIVFTGIVIYLVSIDRKVSKLEKKIKS
ncbi:MAG TPA: CcmD family protein [Bacteroidia bacterium]|nr:CcmD family protein [Bacteroidia bacterium]